MCEIKFKNDFSVKNRNLNDCDAENIPYLCCITSNFHL